MSPSPWWSAQIHADRRPALLARGRIRGALRRRFEEQGFSEVECGALVVSPGNEAHLHAFSTALVGTDGARKTLYLHTSPEFAAKKLLAAGETRIFDFARVFRNRERGPTHAPEFTMLEWYRAGEDYDAVIADSLAILRLAADTTDAKTFSFRRKECDPRAQAQRLTVADAFTHLAGIDLLKTLSPDGAGDCEKLATAAKRGGIDVAQNDNWADIFSKVLVARIEPRLGIERPTVLYEYPRCEAALARATPHDPRVSERFELYICGVELANGFGELTDPVEQRKRFIAEMDEKERIYGERYPLDEDFLSALSNMPPASGVAMGFDRLVMLATGSRKLDDVIWTPAPGGIDNV
ncbi:MAG TPA: EF-P lysine aminoacylase EpmA [Rhizomicrobium sp.]|nr:EF-P lysine aminoacylase EpmA [Rhizomicrobium sp.]